MGSLAMSVFDSDVLMNHRTEFGPHSTRPMLSDEEWTSNFWRRLHISSTMHQWSSPEATDKARQASPKLCEFANMLMGSRRWTGAGLVTLQDASEPDGAQHWMGHLVERCHQ
eukprot:1162461-Amphidinium_carterae.1